MASANQLSPGCMTLFALPFALVGVAMAVWAGSDLVQWQRMRAWKPVECRILYAELEPRRGGDSTTWRVKARYRYEVDNRVYVSDRVSTTVGSDNIGDFHSALYRRLEAHYREGTPARCWVNPGDPRDAVLHREMRWEMFLFKLAFVLTFGGAGWGLIVYSLIARRRAGREPAAAAAAGPGTEVSAAASHAGMLLVMALAFLGLSAGMILPLLDEVKAGNRLALVFFLFPLAGLGLLGGAVHGFLRRRRFGRSRLRLLSSPAGPGESIRGEVRIPAALAAEFCVSLSATMDEKKEKSGARSLWREEQALRSMEYGTFSTLAFDFTLPGELRIPGLQALPRGLLPLLRRVYRGGIPVRWILDLRATVPGVDYHETFLLPPGSVTLTLEVPEPEKKAGEAGGG